MVFVHVNNVSDAQGRQWSFTYEFSEMYGSYAGYDGIQANPCKGPFPYQYT